ncbi:hypothetical protein GCM10009574_046920 [Streptomyces asiaticus]|uniref:Transposase n=2 Tax=Streptomyces rhizosphaericus TaxID=114699 RepID=A0ABN1PCZ6_9ACTN
MRPGRRKAGMAVSWRLRMAVEASAAQRSAIAHIAMKACLTWINAKMATTGRQGVKDGLRKPALGDDAMEETFTYPRKSHVSSTPSVAVPPSDKRRSKTL